MPKQKRPSDLLFPVPNSVVFKAPFKVLSALTGQPENVMTRYIFEVFEGKGGKSYRLFGPGVGTVKIDSQGTIKKLGPDLEPNSDPLSELDHNRVLELFEQGKIALANRAEQWQKIYQEAEEGVLPPTEDENLLPRPERLSAV